jgi:hypothetical protein
VREHPPGMSGGEDEESVFWPTNKRGYELQALVGEVREGGWGVARKRGKGAAVCGRGGSTRVWRPCSRDASQSTW